MNEKSLYKGVFWIKQDDGMPEIISKKIPIDAEGNLKDADSLDLNSKSGDNYNHKLTWESLDHKVREGKPFDHFPRGRVEIKRGKAVIYANPNICDPEIMNLVISEFHLDMEHGIKDMRIIPDHSEHYRCYLDRENGK